MNKVVRLFKALAWCEVIVALIVFCWGEHIVKAYAADLQQMEFAKVLEWESIPIQESIDRELDFQLQEMLEEQYLAQYQAQYQAQLQALLENAEIEDVADTANVEPAVVLNEYAIKVQGIEPIVKTFSATGYCPCSKCCGKSDGITAAGTKATQNHTLAAGRNYPIGTIIYIPKFADWPNQGWFVVEDRGGAISDSRLDVFFNEHQVAWNFGRQSLECYIYLPE